MELDIRAVGDSFGFVGSGGGSAGIEGELVCAERDVAGFGEFWWTGARRPLLVALNAWKRLLPTSNRGQRV